MWYIIEGLIGILLFFVDAFTLWLKNLFVTPFTNLAIMKILVFTYVGLIFSEFYQEKRGTSRGNAISNAGIALAGGTDFLIMSFENGFSGQNIYNLFIAVAIIAYGIYIILVGVLGFDIVKVVGKVRDVCYVIIIFAPVYYTDTRLSFEYFFGAIVFFYIYYMVLETIDRFIPDPKALVDDMKEAARIRNEKNSEGNTA